jgi:hypothetical protein
VEKDLKLAVDKMNELDKKLQEADEKLQGKEFPGDLGKAIAGLVVPFDSANLDGRNVGALPAKVLKPLLGFTAAVQELDKDRESLKNLVGAAQPVVEKAWKEEKDPVAGFSVVFASGGKGVMAELVQIKEPFPVGKEWPDSFTVLKPERTQQGVKNNEKKANRWKKGDLTSGGDPVAIPVSPDSTATFTSQELAFKLQKAMRDLRVAMEGDKSNPTNETAGLIKEGEDLVKSLKDFAAAK